MAAIKTTVFSEYEVRKMNVILPVASEGETADVGTIECIGSMEEEAEVKTVIKKCRGVTKKTRTRGTGTGKLKLTAHIPMELYNKLHAMERPDLVDGVSAYGTNSLHPVFCSTFDVFDEDDVEKLKAYPKCSMTTGPVRKVENGAEEVAECEVEISYNPDEFGEGFYEALADGLAENVKSKWMDAFAPALVRKTDAGQASAPAQDGPSAGAPGTEKKAK